MKFTFALLALLFLTLLPGCKGNDPPAKKITPADLAVESTISTDGSGLVIFHATAKDAASFTFYFGEGLNSPFISTDGIASHSYLTSDTYKVKVLAFSSDNLSIDKKVDIAVNVTIPSAGYTTPATYPGMTLVWSDEFDGDHLNTSDWNYETGGDGWGNHELEYYQLANTSVSDGYLIIKAREEAVGLQGYSSSRLTTQGKKTFQYGRVDIRAMLPKGQGLWPALWMLGSSITTVGWPKCGEIDIMEMIGGGGKDSTVYGTAHWDNGGSHASYGGHKALYNGHLFADEFHVFSIVWTATTIKWYLDDVQYHVMDITADDLSELRAQFFFIFNVAVGGDWPGSPDGTTIFPQRMVVDYIRVFQ